MNLCFVFSIYFFVFVSALAPVCLRAENLFYPEATPILESGKVWADSTFRHTQARSVFRVWYPFPADRVWMVQTDTNRWKDIHSEYTDSRTLDENQFKMIEQKKPNDVRAFYELVGEQIFDSFYNRLPGKVWTSYVFQRFNLPWPLTDRWCVIKVKNDESHASEGMYRYEYKMITGNFRLLKGYWEVVPVEGRPGWTEFRGEYRSDPGIIYPHFVAKRAFRSTLEKDVHENIKAMRKMKATSVILSPPKPDEGSHWSSGILRSFLPQNDS